MGSISKIEKKFVLYALAYFFVWFTFILVPLQRMVTEPVMRFLVFNVGLSFGIFFLMRSVRKNNGSWKLILASFLFAIAIDTWQPGYHVGMDGAIQVGEVLGDSTSDYIIGTFGHDFLRLGGVLLYEFVYVLAPVFMVLYALYLGYSLDKAA